MYWPTSLAQLPLDRQQSLVDRMYNRYRHEAIYAAQKPRTSLIELGPDYVPGRLFFSLQEILELRPPTLPIEPMVDVTNPPFLPIWFCWDHGGQRLVQVDELRQQPAGAAPTPLGPWPAGYGDPWWWSWEPGKGPYAPAPYRGQYDSYALGGPHAVWATQCLIYYKQVIPRGAIFLLEGGSEDHARTLEGSIEAVKSWAQLTVLHRPTGWWFIDQPHLEEYKQRYETFDLTGFEQFMLQLQDTAPTPAPMVEPARGPLSERRNTGRPTGSGKLYPDAHRFVEILGKGTDGFYLEKYRWPTRQEAIKASAWPDHEPSVDLLKARLGTLGLTYTAWINARPKPR